MTSSYLNLIDTNEKAYCLGFFNYIKNTHSAYAKNCYEFSDICIDDDKKTLELFKNIVDIFYDEKTETISMTILNDDLLKDIDENNKNFDKWSDNLKYEYIRGLYEYNYITNDTETDNVLIKENENSHKIGDFMTIPYIVIDGYLTYMYGCSSTDFLGKIYNKINSDSYSIKIANYNLSLPRCCFIRVNEKAEIPSKENWSDVGYDLSIIDKVKDYNSKTSLYDTGIKIQLDFGYYAEIVARSSISKSGYILSNSVGIIDNSYRGNLYIALTKIADDAIDITYPFKCCQLIIKKQEYVNLEEVSEKDLNTTKRNEGGFGSTDNK